MSSTAQRLRERTAIREAGFNYTTKSGFEFKLKRPDPMELIATGVLPLQFVTKLENAQKNKDMSVMNDEDVAISQRLTQKVLSTCIIEPKVVNANPKADEITLSDLTWTEKQELLAAVIAPEKEVTTFRPGQKQAAIA